MRVIFGTCLWVSIVFTALVTVGSALLDTPEAESRLGVHLGNEWLTFGAVTFFVLFVGLKVVALEAELRSLKQTQPNVRMDLPSPIHGYKGGANHRPRPEVVIHVQPGYAPLNEPSLWIVSVNPASDLRSGVSYPTRQFPRNWDKDQSIPSGGSMRLSVFSPDFYNVDHEGTQRPIIEVVMDRIDPKEGVRYMVQYRITGTNLRRPKEFYGFISWESETGFEAEWSEGTWESTTR